MAPAAPTIGIAAFAATPTGTRTLELRAAPPVRAASVIKPLLAWVAAKSGSLAGDLSTWEAYARPAVTTSDNEATAALWSRSGGERLLTALNAHDALGWHVEGDGEHPSLRVLVTSGEVACAYASLTIDDSEAARRVRQWMREVPAEQTFGLRGIASDVLSVDEGAIGVKCGWFGGERAHPVVIAESQGHTVGAAVTTRSSPDAGTLATVRGAIGDHTKLAAAHDALVGGQVRAAVRRALLAARELSYQATP